MIRPRLLAAIVVWVVVVAGASTVVWVVISRAGQQVISADQAVPTTGSSDRQRASEPTRSPTRSSSPATGTSEGSPAAPSPERRTWQGEGGLVVAECTGASVRLVSTQPAVGYHAEVKDSGPEELEVEFEGREDESESKVRVTARCADGVPGFGAETEGEED